MSVTAITAKTPQRALACAVVVACTALTPTAHGQSDLEANKARSMRALGLAVAASPYEDIEANKARSMRALGEHLMSR